MKGEDHQKEKEKTEQDTEGDETLQQEGMMGRKEESKERGKADEDGGGRWCKNRGKKGKSQKEGGRKRGKEGKAEERKERDGRNYVETK